MLVNMNDILLPAKKEHYGVGFFNAVNIEMARAVIETAEHANSPVMIGTAEVLLKYMSLENVASYLIPMAERASVPVCVHYDHGLTFEKCMEAMDLGFTSVMYDCSTLSYEDNLYRLSDMAGRCHERGVTIEGELGHVGDNEGEGKLANPSDYYTDVDLARDFVTRTGIDSLAVAVGNAHGDYKFPPKLDFERIRAISESTGVPLVLHGGSGIPEEDFRKAIDEGICKINIFTDIDKAGKAGIERGILQGYKTMTELMGFEIDAMKDVVMDKMSMFRSLDRV